jgi:hypothetical protein
VRWGLRVRARCGDAELCVRVQADWGCKFEGSIVGAVGSLKLGEVWFRASGLLGNCRLSRKGGAGTSKRKL